MCHRTNSHWHYDDWADEDDEVRRRWVSLVAGVCLLLIVAGLAVAAWAFVRS